jgi:uncharacterized Zn-binding protein involved in type VI secretion
MPPAARISDAHTCPLPTHVGGPIATGCGTVLIGHLLAARVGDTAVCATAPDTISRGASSVLIGYMEAARLGDPTVHGGVIVAGCPTVLIGTSAQAVTLAAAAAVGTPFCEECEKAKRQAG